MVDSSVLIDALDYAASKPADGPTIRAVTSVHMIPREKRITPADWPRRYLTPAGDRVS
ncbi:MAG TPA: hypothetical protein VKV79_01685 [Terriglobia bacterium]|nr:hypothetical protein [Terriglobia bacterium]